MPFPATLLIPLTPGAAGSPESPFKGGHLIVLLFDSDLKIVDSSNYHEFSYAMDGLSHFESKDQ
jgi:hypothetical protein